MQSRGCGVGILHSAVSPLHLNVAGFDTTVPAVIADFVRA
jgi:hypothetical protein